MKQVYRRRSDVEELMSPILPSVVKAVEAFCNDPVSDPFPGEEDLARGTVKARQQEFVTTRRCARDALRRLGYPPTTIGRGSQREPLWPTGVVGAMTHCAGYRAAALALGSTIAGLGIDAEPHARLPDGVLEHVAGPREQSDVHVLLSEYPHIHWDRLMFSAKETLYKVWYPLTHRWLGFEDVYVLFDPQASRFEAHVLTDHTPAQGEPHLDIVHGRFAVTDDLVVTAATVATLPRSC